MAEIERRDDVADSSETLQKSRRDSSGGRFTYRCVKKMVIKIFSHVGLAATVVAYTIMGGFIFRALEAPNESKEKLRIVGLKQTMVSELHQLASHLCLVTIDKSNFTESVHEMLLNFQQQVTVAVKDNGWDGKDETDESALQWSFAGALLYAVTVVTTIGYGHVAPKTGWGRMITIVYALLGIPLTFLYLSNMGNLMAKCFRIFYQKVCCGVCIYRRQWLNQWRCCRPSSAKSDDVGAGQPRSMSIDPRRASCSVRLVLAAQYNKAFDSASLTDTADDASEPEMTSNSGSYEDPAKLVAASSDRRHVRSSDDDEKLTTRRVTSLDSAISGYDDVVNRRPREQSVVDTSARPDVTCAPTVTMRRRIVWRRRLSLESAVESSNCWRCRHPVTLTVDKQTATPSHWSRAHTTPKATSVAHRKRSRISNAVPGNGEVHGELVIDLDEMGLLNRNMDSGNRLEEVNVTVPISICLIIIAAYVSAGSMMFTLWEEWDYLAGCYFCFVTLSTIGFGDLVPGTGMKEWAAHEKLVLCALYLAFGLSMLAMCFNLMQEEVKDKFQWIGRKLGLLKNPDQDDDDDD